MSARLPIPLGAMVAPAERPMLTAAAGQLGECLADPGEPPWPVTLTFDVDPTRPPALIVGTLAAALVSGDPPAVIAQRLGERYGALRAAGCEAIFLCTLFRFVADRRERAAIGPAIRALNLMTAELSHDHGIGVIDIDRIFALFGGRALQADHRLGGIAAPEVAAHVIVAALLANGLDAFVAVDRQERAIARHGGIHQIAATVDRRLNRRAPAAIMSG